MLICKFIPPQFLRQLGQVNMESMLLKRCCRNTEMSRKSFFFNFFEFCYSQTQNNHELTFLVDQMEKMQNQNGHFDLFLFLFCFVFGQIIRHVKCHVKINVSHQCSKSDIISSFSFTGITVLNSLIEHVSRSVWLNKFLNTAFVYIHTYRC